MKKKIFIAIFEMVLIAGGLMPGIYLGGLPAYAAETENVFTYTYNEKVYESDVSEDDAWAKAMLDQMQQGNLTIDEVDAEYAVCGSRGKY